MTGRMSIEQFVALSATNHAHMYGMAPRKGAIAVGADADIAIWNPQREVVVSAAMLHDNVGYTPYEGKHLTGWPEDVFSRGRSVVRGGALLAARGSGQFIARGRSQPLGTTAVDVPAGRRGAFSALLGLTPAP
jgi:dihydropyrimidinase